MRRTLPTRYYRLTFDQIRVIRRPDDDDDRAGLAQWHEDCDRAHGGTPDTIGALFRQLRAEYGRCTGKVYIDHKDGSTHAIGWVFQKQDHFTDTHEPYIRETWITVSTIPETPRVQVIDITTGRIL